MHISVEYCIDCHLHNWCNQHVEAKYQGFYHKLQTSLKSLLSKFTITKNIPPKYYRQMRNLGRHKYFDNHSKRLVTFPQQGAFEVSVNDMLIFSKIKSMMWPCIKKLSYIIVCIEKQLENGNDIKRFAFQLRFFNKNQTDNTEALQKQKLPFCISSRAQVCDSIIEKRAKSSTSIREQSLKSQQGKNNYLLRSSNMKISSSVINSQIFPVKTPILNRKGDSNLIVNVMANRSLRHHHNYLLKKYENTIFNSKKEPVNKVEQFKKKSVQKLQIIKSKQPDQQSSELNEPVESPSQSGMNESIFNEKTLSQYKQEESPKQFESIPVSKVKIEFIQSQIEINECGNNEFQSDKELLIKEQSQINKDNKSQQYQSDFEREESLNEIALCSVEKHEQKLEITKNSSSKENQIS